MNTSATTRRSKSAQPTQTPAVGGSFSPAFIEKIKANGAYKIVLVDAMTGKWIPYLTSIPAQNRKNVPEHKQLDSLIKAFLKNAAKIRATYSHAIVCENSGSKSKNDKPIQFVYADGSTRPYTKPTAHIGTYQSKIRLQLIFTDAERQRRVKNKMHERELIWNRQMCDDDNQAIEHAINRGNVEQVVFWENKPFQYGQYPIKTYDVETGEMKFY